MVATTGARALRTHAARLALNLGVALGLTLVLAACAPAQSPADQPDAPAHDHGGGPVHVHGLGRNPADERIYIATHTGLWRLDEDDRPQRVGEEGYDFMGFTVVGADHFLASGHPGPATDKPPLLGLLESRDGGATWDSLSLLGSTDFHALRAAHERIYAWNATDGTFMVSRDGTAWDRHSDLALLDFVVDPDDPSVVLAATPESLTGAAVVRSDDGGRSWLAVDAPALDRLSWRSADSLLGIDVDGRVWVSADASANWQPVGSVPGRAQALLDAGEDLYTAVGDSLLRSSNRGATWQTLYQADS